MRCSSRPAVRFVLVVLLCPMTVGAQGIPVLDEPFTPDWTARWSEQALNARATVYRVVADGENEAMYARSDGGASALVRRVQGISGVGARLSWRWKVDRPLPSNSRERERRGDDYAARVFVIFGDELTDPDVRALCYVWASSEPVGAEYPSPYVGEVQTIVLRNAGDSTGTWTTEERDIAKDYHMVFGNAPATVGAIALMVDTDDTRSSAAAWFDDVRLVRAEVNP